MRIITPCRPAEGAILTPGHTPRPRPGSASAHQGRASAPRLRQGRSEKCANCAHLINVNSLAMVVDIAPQTELATYTGLYYFASTSAALLGPFIAGLLIDALGKDYGVIFPIAAVMFAVAFGLMLGVRRGERAETVTP
ncbi:MAG TPA: MFS transporter [Anaerolineae bacterium]